MAMDEAALTSWLDEQTARHDFSGVALVWRGGEPVLTYAGGLADRGHSVPVTGDTRFGVASITKMVVAAATLRLVDRGDLALDARLVDLLPADQRPKSVTSDHTLHHLLSHTSGIANYHDDDDDTWASFTSCWDRIPTYRLRRPADMLPLFVDLPAVAAPGETFQYGDANYLLVGLVLEAVAGRPWSEVVTTEVFEPAGMRDSAIEALDDDPSRVATGYLATEEPYESWKSNIFSVTAAGMPDGGMFTTASDLARLVDALVGGGLLTPESTAAMLTPQGPAGDDLEQYGYGCELTIEDGEVTIIGHGGSDPGVSTLLSHYLAQATTVVVLCNQDRGSWPVTQRLAREFELSDPRE